MLQEVLQLLASLLSSRIVFPPGSRRVASYLVFLNSLLNIPLGLVSETSLVHYDFSQMQPFESKLLRLYI